MPGSLWTPIKTSGDEHCGKGLVAGCQGIEEKIFKSAHGRTPSSTIAPSRNELEWHLFAGC
jgi:hypothetical protein